MQLEAESRSWKARWRLAEAVAILNPTTEDRAHARRKLLTLLTAEAHHSAVSAHTSGVWQLARTVATLNPTAAEREQVLAILLRLVIRHPLQGRGEVLAALTVTDEERTLARRALLRLLDNESGHLVAAWSANAVVMLNPTAEDRAQARRRLFTLLATETRGSEKLLAGVTRLTLTGTERSRYEERCLRCSPESTRLVRLIS